MFTFIGSTFFGYVNHFVNSVSTQLSVFLSAVAITALTLYYIVMGFAVMRGTVQDPIITIIWNSLKKAMILTVALGTGVYQTEVIGTVNYLSAGLMESVANAAPNSTGCATASIADPAAVLALLDCNVAKGLRVFEVIFNQTAKFEWYQWGDSLFLILPTIIYALCFGLMLVAVGLEFFINMLTLYLVLAIGPIFIASLAFEPTKNFFEGWKNKILYCLIMQMFVMILIGMAFSIIASYIDSAGFGSATGNYMVDHGINILSTVKMLFNLCVIMILFSYMFTKLDNITASITGGGDNSSAVGMVLATTQLVKTVSKAVSGVRGGASQGGKIENSSQNKGVKHAAHKIAERFRGK